MKKLSIFKSESDAMAAFEECAVRLERLRDQSGLKQQELVKSCDFNQPTYSLFVARSPMYIGENTLLRVCADCRVKVNGEYLPFNEQLKRPLINGKSFMWWMIHLSTFDANGKVVNSIEKPEVPEQKTLGQVVERTFSFADAIKVVEQNDPKPLTGAETLELFTGQTHLKNKVTPEDVYHKLTYIEELLNKRLTQIEKMIQKLYPAGLK